MNKKSQLILPVAIIMAFVSYLYFQPSKEVPRNKKDLTILNKEEEGDEMEKENSRRRAAFEWTIQRDPKTGKIPEGIREKELELLKILPVRANGIFNGGLTSFPLGEVF